MWQTADLATNNGSQTTVEKYLQSMMRVMATSKLCPWENFQERGHNKAYLQISKKLSLLPQTDCKRISKGRTLLQKEGSKGRCEIQEKNEKQKKMCKRVDKIMVKLRRQMSPVGVTKKERGTFNSLYVGRECMTEVKYIHRSP